jgi:hypothetical protein
MGLILVISPLRDLDWWRGCWNFTEGDSCWLEGECGVVVLVVCVCVLSKQMTSTSALRETM